MSYTSDIKSLDFQMLKNITLMLIFLMMNIKPGVAADTGKITIVSDFYAACGLAVALYDKDDRLLAIEKYLTTRDYRKVLFNYEPQAWRLPIDSFITVRTQYPAMHRTGCEAPYQINSYRIPWLSDKDICLMVDISSITPCDPILIYDAPAKFIGIYPPRRRNIWTPSQMEYYQEQR